ncbi:MAG: nicotinate-nucleotide adenylyltransferase [Alphaproteobacteria bacterium]|nr:nicotinate-nucleotide adenylyltransferase [Alphaproteobacteria bacterium]
MGGSFNPPHEGHLIVARTALRRLRLDRLWWVVTPGNPLKSHEDLPGIGARIEAVKALAHDPRMLATAFESELGSPYTSATTDFLQSRYPQSKFVLVIGADNLATFHHWRNWREIAGSVPLGVVDRPGWRLKALASPAARALAGVRCAEHEAAMLPDLAPPAWVFLSTRLSHQSSTALRSSRSSRSNAAGEI